MELKLRFLCSNLSLVMISLSVNCCCCFISYVFRFYVYMYYDCILLPARRRPQGLVVIGVCLSVRTASAQVCVPLGHSSLYLMFFILYAAFGVINDERYL